MANWIYSIESFPSDARKGDYVQVTGIQVIIPAGTWMKLEPKYERYWWTDFRHRGAGSTNEAKSRARKDVYSSDDIADSIMAKYNGFGIVRMDEDPTTHAHKREKLEAEAKVANDRYRSYVVARFEDERKTRQLTGRGRMEPTAYELECYRVLGMPEPGTLEGIKAERGTTEVKFELPPEVAELVAEGLAARRKAAEPAPVAA